MVTWMYTFAKTHLTVFLKWVCLLCVNYTSIKSILQIKRKKLSFRDSSSTSHLCKACLLQSRFFPKNHQSHDCITGPCVIWALVASLTLFPWLMASATIASWVVLRCSKNCTFLSQGLCTCFSSAWKTLPQIIFI